jgi:hypothetical protein
LATTELAPLYLAGSAVDAARRGRRGDFARRRGRIALLLTVIAWALLGLIHRRNVRSTRISNPDLREALGDDYASVAAASKPAEAARRAPDVVVAPPLRREGGHRALRTAPRQRRRHLAAH